MAYIVRVFNSKCPWFDDIRQTIYTDDRQDARLQAKALAKKLDGAYITPLKISVRKRRESQRQ